MRHIEHFLLLSWLLTIGLVGAGVIVLLDTGMLQNLVATDRSYVSLVLIAMYVIGAGHSLRRTWLLSVELGDVATAERLLAQSAGAPLSLGARGIALAQGALLPGRFLTDYVRDLVRATHGAAGSRGEGASTDLLEASAARLRGEHEFGWFVIDLMLKVGFLGTLVGFIWMLSSVSKHSVIDAQSMQLILRDMSYGMGIALNTTLISLVTATLLSAPYYLLSRGLDELIECTVRLTQVEVLPRLSRAA
jgi:hypothetical protein